MKISFLLMAEYLKYQQIYTMLKLIEAAREKGHEINGIFIFGSGVINLQKKVEAGRNTRNIPEELGKVAEKGIPIYACQTWADYYGIFPENTTKGIEIVGLGELSNIAYEADKLITLSAQ